MSDGLTDEMRFRRRRAFAAEVRERREALGLSRADLAELLGERQAYVDEIEDAGREAGYPPEEFRRLAEALRTTTGDLETGHRQRIGGSG